MRMVPESPTTLAPTATSDGEKVYRTSRRKRPFAVFEGGVGNLCRECTLYSLDISDHMQAVRVDLGDLKAFRV